MLQRYQQLFLFFSPKYFLIVNSVEDVKTCHLCRTVREEARVPGEKCKLLWCNTAKNLQTLVREVVAVGLATSQPYYLMCHDRRIRLVFWLGNTESALKGRAGKLLFSKVLRHSFCWPQLTKSFDHRRRNDVRILQSLLTPFRPAVLAGLQSNPNYFCRSRNSWCINSRSKKKKPFSS